MKPSAVSEEEYREAGRELARGMARYLWAWTIATNMIGVGMGLGFGGAVAPWGAGLLTGAGLVALTVTAFAWRSFCNHKAPEGPTTPVAEEALGAELYATGTGDCPVSFTLSAQGRDELNRAAIRLRVSQEQAIKIAIGNFLHRYGREVSR